MNSPGRRPRARATAIVPIAVVNVGVLVALLFGPNGDHPSKLGVAVGIATIAVGAYFAIRLVIHIRRERASRW